MHWVAAMWLANQGFVLTSMQASDFMCRGGLKVTINSVLIVSNGVMADVSTVVMNCKIPVVAAGRT